MAVLVAQREEVVVSGLRAARELAGLSQSELARRMTTRGFNWSQMTVSRREANEDTLRWGEGIVLREIVGYPGFTFDCDPDTAADALAYQRILRVIGEREASVTNG